jgi:putative FmdB family regulatory protein
MPLYDYHCEDCGEQSELLMSGAAAAACPACGSVRMSKLLPIVASPAREPSGDSGPEPPSRPCGPSCGCHPRL